MAEEVAGVAMRPVGDGALLIELGSMAPSTTARARSLATAIRGLSLPGVYDVVPAYRTVLVCFDPLQCAGQEVGRRVQALLPQLTVAPQGTGRLVELPVCYGGEHGPDLQDVARHTGLSPEEVVRCHAEALYTVEFIGFSPGFPYLSGLPERLATPRLPSPRTRVAGGSVAIGGRQTGFYPMPSPGGWRLIGRIPSLHFDPAHPELLPYGPGDLIRFDPIDSTRYTLLAQEPAAHRAPGYAASSPAMPGEGTHGLRVIAAGLLSTVQDKGRLGLAAQGYSPAGALDDEALSIANLLVGNPPEAAGIELTLGGSEFVAEGDLVIALAGADLSPCRDGEPLPLWQAVALRAGCRLRFGSQRSGVRAYLAVAGGVRTPPVLGSRATDLVAGLGGIDGRPLRAGDLLPVGEPVVDGRAFRLAPGFAPCYPGETQVRVIWGPQEDWFTGAARETFVGATYRASARSDRTGLRLDGPALTLALRQDLASEGGVPGSVQVPPDGKPIVLLADGRGVGGYPKIATVISADLHRLAQAAPGTVVRFRPISLEEATRLAREARQRLQHLPLLPAPEPAVRCLLEGRPGVARCPRTLACLVARRCLLERR